MIKIGQILSIIILFVNVFCYSQNNLLFEGEDLTFELSNDTFSVRGLYYFNSETKGEYSILYPFPTDTIYSKPFDIHTVNLTIGDTVNYRVNKNCSAIYLSVDVNGETTMYISYSQSLKANKAKYILLTTNYWEKPLNRADYKLVTNRGLAITKFSIPPDKKMVLENKKIYLWQKKDFKPTVDFEIEY